LKSTYRRSYNKFKKMAHIYQFLIFFSLEFLRKYFPLYFPNQAKPIFILNQFFFYHMMAFNILNHHFSMDISKIKPNLFFLYYNYGLLEFFWRYQQLEKATSFVGGTFTKEGKPIGLSMNARFLLSNIKYVYIFFLKVGEF